MHSLRDLQTRFAEAIFATKSTGFGLHIRPNGLGSARRFSVYRNNVVNNLTEALRVSYPVVERLVGAEFFAVAARCYVRDVPSRSGNLHDYGAAFPAHLARLPGAAALGYLSDVARLEWACQEIFHAPEAEPLDLEALAAVPAERHDDLRLYLHPASRLLASDYPLFRIWQVNQAGYVGEDTVDLAMGGVRLLVIRPGLEIDIEPLSAGEYTLLVALNDDRTLASACESALAAEPALDLAATLSGYIARRIVVGLSY